MPEAASYWTLNQDADRSLLDAAQKEREARRQMIKRHWDYYDGNHPKPLKVAHGRVDNNVIINVIQMHVDHTVSFAAPDFPSIELQSDKAEEEETPADETIEAQIDDLWDEQGGATWLQTIMQQGCLAGHNFVRLIPATGEVLVDDGDGNSTVTVVMTEDYPRLVALNPANVLCYWQQDDYQTLLWYELMYKVGKEERRQDILAPGTADNKGWQIREYAKTGTGWVLINTYDWAYEHAPIIDWQHLPRPNSYYGKHECGNIGLNDAINKVASDIKAILRTHASPRVFLFGVDAKKLSETAIEAVWSLPEGSDAKVLEMQSDLASSMNFMDFLTKSFFNLSRTTILSGGPDAYKNITNLGIKAAFMGQTAKTETLHRQYGEGLSELTEAALELMGVTIDDPTIEWGAALPESELEQAQYITLLDTLQYLSKQTGSGMLNLDYELEQDRLDAENQDMQAMAEKVMNAGFGTVNAVNSNMNGNSNMQGGNGNMPMNGKGNNAKS